MNPRARHGGSIPVRIAPTGFTLVEILLTLAILSTILALLLSAFTGAARSLEMLSDRSGSFRQLRIAMDRIGSDLAGALASDAIEATALSCKTDDFSGKPASTLIFTAFTLPETAGARPSSDIVKIRYFPKVSADGRYIELYREQSDLPLVENRIPTRETRLASRLLAFRVELYDGKAWVKEWPAGGRKLPEKAAIVLKDFLGQEYRRTLSLPLAGQEASVLLSGRRAGG
ncbi:MAG: prepilin-type N-terminal cleavage/methylation domain-containing protein [Deltaproteobacteria bacterium]|nr:prepilin-type N-terminal cleavage/methylation domain-containing protein [Deltaproteobacteria bacterium]